jgi:hypothetical protein
MSMPTSSAPSRSCAVARIANPAEVRVKHCRSDQDQAVCRDGYSGERHDTFVWRGHPPEVFAPDALRDAFEDQHDPDRGNHRVEMRRAAKRPEHDAFERDADAGERKHRGSRGHPVMKPRERDQ